MQDKRIKGENIEIDYSDTLSFFDSRGNNTPLKHKYNYVLFQDEQPELAIERDCSEKRKINSVLTYQAGECVLDIGCGVGRWGEDILERGVNYVGIDYSERLLEIAKENLNNYKHNCTLLHSSVQNMMEKLSQADLLKRYDKIFINGVLMYLNDNDLIECMNNLCELISLHNGTIYIKESVASEERLTLNRFYSKDLKHDYTAIYRTVSEYDVIIKKYLKDRCGFSYLSRGELFENELKNRKETLDYYYILQKG